MVVMIDIQSDIQSATLAQRIGSPSHRCIAAALLPPKQLCTQQAYIAAPACHPCLHFQHNIAAAQQLAAHIDLHAGQSQ